MASADFIQLSTPSLINAYHNELSFLWDVNMNASEEQKGLASARLSSHTVQHICRYCTNVRYATNSVHLLEKKYETRDEL